MNARLPLALLAFSALAGCASSGAPRAGAYDPNATPSVCLLGPFSHGGNGAVTKAEMEAGIKAGFAAADLDHNGSLNTDELYALNEMRSKTCDTSSQIDWSGTGRLGIDDYASRYRTAFEQADVNADGIASAEEIVTSRRQLPKVKRKPAEEPDSGPTRNPTGSPTGSPTGAGSPY